MSSEADRTFEWEVDAASRGTRIDVWIESQLEDVSRSRVKALIETGDVTRNGVTPKAHQKLAPGDRVIIRIPPEPSAIPAAENIPLTILHQDPDIAVINKPPGCVVHPAPGHTSGTLVNALLHHFPQLATHSEPLRPGIVHRLDQDTSGIIIVALTEAATQALVAQFKSGTVEKHYDAIVSGCPHPASQRIETELSRHPVDRKRMAVCDRGGKRAVTVYHVVESLGSGRAALLSVQIETGRTHQIRVHVAHCGHPVLGDSVYARRHPKPWPVRQMLHARRIHFNHPRTSEPLSFEAEPPQDMRAFLEQLRALES